MKDFYSARCPGCNAVIEGTLDENPDVPFYACGGWGYRCSAQIRLPEAPNVHALTAEDAAILSSLVDAADAGLLHVERARGR